MFTLTPLSLHRKLIAKLDWLMEIGKLHKFWTKKGGVLVTRSLKILPLSRSIQPPTPPYPNPGTLQCTGDDKSTYLGQDTPKILMTCCDLEHIEGFAEEAVPLFSINIPIHPKSKTRSCLQCQECIFELILMMMNMMTRV